MKTATTVLNLLLEGMSIRAAARVTGVNKDTVQRLVEIVGWQCHDFLAHAVNGVEVDDLQIDEVWSFVAAKEKSLA